MTGNTQVMGVANNMRILKWTAQIEHVWDLLKHSERVQSLQRNFRELTRVIVDVGGHSTIVSSHMYYLRNSKHH